MIGIMSDKNYHEIVLTGASASGKTTALSYLAQELEDRGIKVLSCPETATILLQSGLGDVPAYREEYPERFWCLQKSILGLQLEMREHMRRQAQAIEGQVVILYDRGEMDVLAYAGEELFSKMLAEEGLTKTELRDQYDAIIHLVSVAVDYPQFYNNHNNPARWEDPEQAKATNKRLLHAWTGAPHLWVVDNQHRLEGKLERTLDIVLHTMGLPQPVEREHKFLLGLAPNEQELLEHGASRIDIEQYYLEGPLGSFRIRARSQGGVATYYHTVKEELDDGTRAEYEHRISRDDYYRLLEESGGEKRVLRKHRWCFAQHGHYYELDHISLPEGDMWLLEVEVLPGDSSPLVPEWLGDVQEVTSSPDYSSSSLAKSAQD